MKKVFFLIGFLLISDVAKAQEKPGLLITPTRVTIEGRARSAAVSLANNGNVEGTYAISIVNRRMLEDGSIKPVEEAMEGDKFADHMLRISPRRVTLQPGEHQNVRILARKPSGLEDGEYRSHLNFKIIPKDDTLEREKVAEENSLTINIKANFGVTIPIIVREGDVVASSTIDNLKISSMEDGGKEASFSINRTGNRSLYGDIIILYKNNDGKEYILKSLGGLAVYTPNQKRTFKIRLDIPDGVKVDDGTVEVKYKEKAKEGGKILASKVLEL
jgi:hypothetical protein